MNLRELEWRARQLTGTAVNDDGLETLTEIADAIRDAYRNVLDVEDWPFLYQDWSVTVDAGEDMVDLPEDVSRVYTVHSDDWALAHRPPERLVDVYKDGDGRPRQYALWGRKLMVRPTPTRPADLRIMGRSNGGTLDWSDEPAFDRAYHPMLAYLAASEVLSRRGDDDGRIAHYEERADGLLSNMRHHYRADHDRQPIVVGGREHYRPAARPRGLGGRRVERVR